ncbi:MAG: GAF domain-containing protein [Anaerolineae bacterium]|nr:GAF domain-containing protein [Anaerolineae bacterium]
MRKTVLGLPSNRQTQWTSVAEKITWGHDQMGLLAGLILLLAMIALLSPHFRQLNNFKLILQEASFIGIVAAGQTLVVLTGGIDLSVGSIAALTGIVAALLMQQGIGPLPPLNPYLAIGVALGVGALIGLGHGLLIAKRNMPPFIVTLVSLGVLRGIALVLTEGRTVHSLPDEFKWMSDAYVGGIPMPGVIMLVTFLILGFVLRNTKMGRYTYAIGGNETSARLSGVPVDRYKIYTYMLSGFVSALVGIILIARLDGAVYTHGEDYGLNSVAAVIIGGTSLQGGTGGVWGTLLGVLIMTVVKNGLVMLDIPYQWHGIIIGSIILLAIFFDMERRRVWQSVPKVRTSPPITDSTYLEGIVTQITQLIHRRFGSPYLRIYMVDPKMDDLIECRADGQVSAKPKSIVNQVKTTGRSVILDDLAAGYKESINPLDAHIQSAVAIPLTLYEQMIGVLEVQSPVAHAFVPETATRLTELTQEVIAPLQNAWLLECGWLASQTRDALRHLWDDVYLGHCALAEWAFPGLDFDPEGGPAARGGRLRRLLLDAIENLKPETNSGGARTTDRRYDILRLTYLEDLTVDEAIKELTVSRRQYFYDLKDAIGTLAHLLVRTHPIEN